MSTLDYERIGPDPAALRSAGRIIRALAKRRISMQAAYPRLSMRLFEWIKEDVQAKWKFEELDPVLEIFYAFMDRVVRYAPQIQDKVEAGISLQAYLWGIATNLANSRWHVEIKKQRLLNTHGPEYHRLQEKPRSPELELLLTEKLRVIHQVIETLPAEERLLMKLYSESAPRHIAEELGESSTVVQKRINRVLNKLRRAVKKRMNPCPSRTTSANISKPSGPRASKKQSGQRQKGSPASKPPQNPTV